MGVDPIAIKRTIYQSTAYIGYPRTLNAMNIIDEVAGKMECQQA